MAVLLGSSLVGVEPPDSANAEGAASAFIDRPAGVAADGNGNIYVSDTQNCRVRKISSGTIVTIAGTGLCGYDAEGTATSVRLNHPRGLFVDASGANLYIADTDNCRIRKLVLAGGGQISTVAGSGSCGFSNGAPTAAMLNRPRGVAVIPSGEEAGDILVADTDNCLVRHVDFRTDPSQNTVLIAAGGLFSPNGCGFSGDGGDAHAAKLGHPSAVTLIGTSVFLVADTDNCRIRKVEITSPYIITTAAGGDECGFGGDGGTANGELAKLNHTRGIAGGADYFIADSDNCRVRSVVSGPATLETAAGSGTCAYAGADGTSATAASLNAPEAVAVSGSAVIIADTANCVVRQVSGGLISKIAGMPGQCDADGDNISTPSDNCPDHANANQADSDSDYLGDACEASYGTNAADADTDDDGCRDGREVRIYTFTPQQGGDRDPLNPWDFYDVPTPALTSANPNGTKNRVVSLADVGAVLFYVGTVDNGGANGNGVDYDTDWNNNGVEDGREYDRSPSTTPGKPWRSGAPNGAVSLQDASVALTQVGHSCVD